MSDVLNSYGGEFGKTLIGFNIDVGKCLKKGDGSEILNLRVVLKCDEKTIWDSKTLLYRDVLCFSGKKEINVESCKKGVYSFFIPTDKSLYFYNSDEPEIYEEGAFREYFVNLCDGFVIKTDDAVLAFDKDNDNKNSEIEMSLPKGKKDIYYIYNGKRYEVISELGIIKLYLQSSYDIQKILLKINGERISLSKYKVEEFRSIRLYEIPVCGDENDICEFEIIDTENKNILASKRLKYSPSLSWRFDKDIYYTEKDYEDANVTVFSGRKTYKEKFGIEQNTILVSEEEGTYEIKIPKIVVRKNDGSIWKKRKIFLER